MSEEEKRSYPECPLPLTPEQYHVLREAGTEPPFQNKYWNEHAFCLTESQHPARIAEGLVMAATRKTQRMKRLHFWLPAEDLEAVRRIAARRGTSISQVVRAALKRELDEEYATLEKMLSIVGIGKGLDPRGSERHDDLIYGQNPD